MMGRFSRLDRECDDDVVWRGARGCGGLELVGITHEHLEPLPAEHAERSLVAQLVRETLGLRARGEREHVDAAASGVGV